MTSYLTGASNQHVRAVAKSRGIGLLIQPGTKQYLLHLADYPFWAIDNGCFSPKNYVGDEAYVAWLATLPRTALFATAPDVVGDAAATLERSRPMLARIRALGFAVALVAQDGLEALAVPWDEFDVLFIGGTSEWKDSGAARELVRDARDHGKRTHIGRVNTLTRFFRAERWDVDTVDGTFLAFGPEMNLPRLLSWLDLNPTPALAVAA